MPGRDSETMRRLRRRLAAAAGPSPPPPAKAARPCPWRDTLPEQIVADWLQRLNVPCVPQHRLLPGVTVDFWVPDRGLVIEVQGTWFHADPAGSRSDRLTAAASRKRRADAALQRWCQRAGVAYLELWEEDLRRRPQRALDRLQAALGPRCAAVGGEERSAMSVLVREAHLAGGVLLQLRRGDLTAEAVTAIVNAANGHLAHGGGVAGAIVRAGGAVIQAESDAWVRRFGPLANGQVALTGGGNLPCRAVIHAVGPVWHGGEHGEPEQLRLAVTHALELAGACGFASVAVPAISSGIFGFPKDRCAAIICAAAADFAQQHPVGSVREIRCVNFDAPTVEVFAAEFDRLATA